MTGIIDWGDAMITDPFYELVALHLGAFSGDRRLLGQFLTGYGWRLDEGFADHALQVTLMHQFDCLGISCLPGQSRQLPHGLSERDLDTDNLITVPDPCSAYELTTAAHDQLHRWRNVRVAGRVRATADGEAKEIRSAHDIYVTRGAGRAESSG